MSVNVFGEGLELHKSQRVAHAKILTDFIWNVLRRYAMKVMDKHLLKRKNMVDQVVTERDAMALVRNEFCVRLYYSFRSPSAMYLVMVSASCEPVLQHPLTPARPSARA